MWIKNAIIYNLTESFELSAEDLAEKLKAFEFKPCGSLDPWRVGFVPPLGRNGTDFVHSSGGVIGICYQQEEKILPAAVINKEVDHKVAALQDAESRKVGRKERQELKDEVIFSMLPKAFTRITKTYAFIDTVAQVIYVDAASVRRAEDVLSVLREALGSLRCLPITSKNNPASVMTSWVRDDDIPESVVIGNECELKCTRDDRVVRCKNLDLQADEVLRHIDCGMAVTKLAVTWSDYVSFILDYDLQLKRIKFDDKLFEQSNDRNPESHAEQFDADFCVMTLEFRKLLDDLKTAFN